MDLPAYEKLDMETCPRREHFRYYRERLRCGCAYTARVDVTKALNFAHKTGRRFYGCFLYAAARTVNELPEMRMMVTPEGAPGVWEVSHPNFTVFHEEDGTFSDLWQEYSADFERFYAEFELTLARWGDKRGIKPRPNQPANFFCISCVPWLDFTGYSTWSPGEPALFPIITFGKYTRGDGGYSLPVTLNIAHAAADGWHCSRFFKVLQENLDRFAD